MVRAANARRQEHFVLFAIRRRGRDGSGHQYGSRRADGGSLRWHDDGPHRLQQADRIRGALRRPIHEEKIRERKMLEKERNFREM